MKATIKSSLVLSLVVAVELFCLIMMDRYLTKNGIESQYITLTFGLIVSMITFYAVIYIYSQLNLRAIKRILK